MKKFGEKWGGEELEKVATPVGEPCFYCEEPIVEGDLGVTMPFLDTDGPKEVAEHRECMLRSVFGSVGHQLRKCSCHGGDEEDPPGLTMRQAAQAAVSLFEKKS